MTFEVALLAILVIAWIWVVVFGLHRCVVCGCRILAPRLLLHEEDDGRRVYAHVRCPR